MWKLSSAGRASALQAEGHRFEPYSFHHIKVRNIKHICGNGSVVERHLAKVDVAGSNLVSRSKDTSALLFYVRQGSAKP